jgi:CO/xanthine dehydrogenase FAD-binding subunit
VVGDLYGSADYKRHLVRVLAARALKKAAGQAGRAG